METFFNVSEQTMFFLWSCVIGAFLGVVFDMFRVARIIFKHNRTAVFIEDTLFVVFSSLVIFTYCTEAVRGEIRGFIIAGVILGFILYIITVGTIVVTITKKIVLFIIKILCAIYNKICRPIIKLIVKMYLKIKNKIVQNAIKLKKQTKNKKKLLKNTKGL